MKLVAARVAVVVVAVVGCSHLAGAQAISGTVFSNGSIQNVSDDFLVLGPLVFRPAVQFQAESRDNLFLRPGEDAISDQGYSVGARLQFELPISEASSVRLEYSPRWHQFEKYKIENELSHVLNLDASFVSPIGLEFDGSYGYTRGSLDTREIDPGGELGYSSAPNSKQVVNLDSTYWLSPRDGVSAGGSYLDVSFDGEGFFPYQDTTFWGAWKRQLTPTLNGDLRFTHSERDAGAVSGSSVSRDGSSNDATLGLHGAITPLLDADLRVGWRESSYTQLSSGDKPTFSGVVVKGGLTWKATEGMSLGLTLSRSDQPSAFGGNPYLTATGAGVSWRLSRGLTGVDLSMRYQQNSYERDPLGGERSDDLTSLGVGVDRRIGNRLVVRGAYHYGKRDSQPSPDLDYTVNIFTVSLVAGY